MHDDKALFIEPYPLPSQGFFPGDLFLFMCISLCIFLGPWEGSTGNEVDLALAGDPARRLAEKTDCLGPPPSLTPDYIFESSLVASFVVLASSHERSWVASWSAQG